MVHFLSLTVLYETFNIRNMNIIAFYCYLHFTQSPSIFQNGAVYSMFHHNRCAIIAKHSTYQWWGLFISI